MWLDRSAVHNGAQQREEVGRGEDRRSAFLGRMRVSAYVNDANGEPEGNCTSRVHATQGNNRPNPHRSTEMISPWDVEV
jgi:hypothetical protein